MGSETVQVAPPFGEGVEVVGGERTPSGVIIWPTVSGMLEPGEPPVNKPALLRFYSENPLLLVTWVEKGGKTGWQISFWK